MQTRKMLTIITESLIETMLLKDIEQLGAKGYTIIDVRGKGSRGVRGGDWDQSQNIRIEIICDESTAQKLIEHCTKTYYEHYAMVLYVSDVEIVRGEKF
jgi:nitrogen regulatory protein PII